MVQNGNATIWEYVGAAATLDIPAAVQINGVLYNVTSIGGSTFKNCSSLTSITFEAGSKLTSIGWGAFSGCSSLTSITLPSSVTSIGDYAFAGCSSLTSITIPSSVTSIDEYTFRNCSSLTIYCEAASQPSGWNSYWNNSYRPVVWGCGLSSDKSYVISFTKTWNRDHIESVPYRGGYTFGGWFTNAEFTGTSYTTDFSDVTDGTVLYVKWTVN